MQGNAITSDFFPVATDKEFLLASVFGEIPDFADPKQPNARTSPQDIPEEDCDLVEKCRRELCSDTTSSLPEEQRTRPIYRLLTAITPAARKRKNVILVDRTKKSKRKKGQYSPRIRTAPPPNLEPRVTHLRAEESKEVKTEAVVEPLNETTLPAREIPGPSVPETFLESDILPSRAAAPVVFAAALFSVPCELREIGRKLTAQFPSVPTFTGRKADVAQSETSPLASFPGLFRDMRLFYQATSGQNPYSLTWENKILMKLPLCSHELKEGKCQLSHCSSQHTIDYELSMEEKLKYSHSVGYVDRQRLSGKQATFLHWPKSTSKKGVTSQMDVVPLYVRSQGIEGFDFLDPSTKPASSLLRSIQLNLDDLRMRGIQLSMDYTMVDILEIFPVAEYPLPSTPSDFPGDASEASDEVAVLNAALLMIEGEHCLNPSSRRKAQQFLSKKIAICPHQRMLWQLYLALFFRDSWESEPSKMHQSQLCTSTFGTWYRPSLMVAAMKSTPEAKLATLQETIESLVAEQEPGNAPGHIGECCLDLALRVIHIEVSTSTEPFRDSESFCGTVLSHLKNGRLSDMSKSDSGAGANSSWVHDLLAVLQQDIGQRCIFCLSLVYALLHSKLPSAIVHSLGFPKHLRIFPWSRKDPGDEQVEGIRHLLSWVTAKRPDFPEFFGDSAGPTDTTETKQCFAANVMLLVQQWNRPRSFKYIKRVFPQYQQWKTLSPEASFSLLTVGKTLDEIILYTKDEDLQKSRQESGYIVEHVLNAVAESERPQLPKSWLGNEKAAQPMNPRTLLAVAKSHIEQGRSEDGEMLLGDLAPEMTSSGKFFHCLNAFYSSIMKKHPVDIDAFLPLAMGVSQECPSLTERLWMELIVLLAAALPKREPAESHPEDMEIDPPSSEEEISFSVMKACIEQRTAAFSGLLAMIEVYSKNHIQHVRALDNFVEDIAHLPPKLRSVLAPQMSEISTLLDNLLFIVPHLQQHEIMKLVEMLCELFPTSPTLAEFLLRVIPSVPDYDRSCLRYLVTLLLHSVPMASFDVWTKAVEIGYQHGQHLGSELSSCVSRIYPNWKRKASV